MNRWTVKEEEFIFNNFNSLTDLEIARKLNRTYNSVRRKRQQLKLSKKIFNGFLDKKLKNNYKILKELDKVHVPKMYRKIPRGVELMEKIIRGDHHED